MAVFRSVHRCDEPLNLGVATSKLMNLLTTSREGIFRSDPDLRQADDGGVFSLTSVYISAPARPAEKH
jgi:hypothetical protein